MRFPVFGAALAVLLLVGCASHHTKKTEAQQDAKRAPEYHSLYNKPLTSLGAKYMVLTAAAQTTVLAEAGSAEVYDVVKNVRGNQVYFVVYFKDSAMLPPLYIAPDGSVLNPDLSVAVAAPKEVTPTTGGAPIMMSEVPPNVQKVLLDHASHAEVTAINKENWGDRAVYIFTFKDEAKYPKFYVLGDGAVMYAAPK